MKTFKSDPCDHANMLGLRVDINSSHWNASSYQVDCYSMDTHRNLEEVDPYDGLAVMSVSAARALGVTIAIQEVDMMRRANKARLCIARCFNSRDRARKPTV